jgi:flagellar hook-length control protein FliK
LERLGKDLGVEHKPLGHALREAVAELRYTQLANGPDRTPDQQFLVPLLVPQLSQDNPEGKLQVYQRAAKKGEPIDPNNVRFVFVLDTEHMATVQADMSIKDGQIDLQIGVPDAEDRAFLAQHLDQLKDAIADQGWETGRFAARQARGLPPRLKQEEGLTEVVRFDKRV